MPKYICGLPTIGAKACLMLKMLSEHRDGLLFVTEHEEDIPDFQDALTSLISIGIGKHREKSPPLKDGSPVEKTGGEALSSFRAGTQGAASASPPEILTFGEDPWSRSLALASIAKRGQENNEQDLIILSTSTSLSEEILRPQSFSNLSFEIKVGSSYKRPELVARLENAGYERTDFVETPGEYAVRGSIIDIGTFFPNEGTLSLPGNVPMFSVPSSVTPIRLFFSGDILESARLFDIPTQRTTEFMDKTTILPAKMPKEGVTLKDWISGSFVCLVNDDVPEDEVFQRGESRCFFSLTTRITMLSSVKTRRETMNFGAAANMRFHADVGLTEKEVKRLRAAGCRCVIFCLNKGEEERLTELFADTAVPDICEFHIGGISQGFHHPGSKLAVITSGEILGRSYRPAASLKYFGKGQKRYRWSDLKTADYIVHEDYGIGRYLGLKRIAGDVDCLYIEYKNSDKLFVPLYEFRKVHKYIGSEGRAPRLSSMDTKQWQKVKSRVKKGIENIARDILKTQAERALVKGFSFGEETYIEREFADSFPFEETPDQRNAIAECLNDMSATKPMDRIVVGDVGFGKTEVAMRAALKCAVGGKQAAILVPTTILAEQHYRTFSERFSGFPVNISVLSRFQTRGEQRKTLERIHLGVTDIVIGTHRLLQKDVKFKNLGLMVADEEHRFGVKDKEKFKKLAKGVHMLMLSATPIPRTLYQTLSSLRAISVIESPPTGRLPISTIVMPWDQNAAVSAIRAEIARGGQVYYVHNRVTTLPARREFLKRLLPEVRFGMAHGQMNSDSLEKTMWDFFRKKYDVLLASTIIESGLDIPSVNTLIVENAHEFGLAQLYQLRGRIGRERQKAFCCLFYPQWLEKMPGPDKVAAASQLLSGEGPVTTRDDTRHRLPEGAVKRLSALQEFGELGSGFRLAMRDLEIRGAGELLGIRQHGFLNEIGLNSYCELLTGEINRLKDLPSAAGDRALKDESASPPALSRGSAATEGSKEAAEGLQQAVSEPAVLDIRITASIPENYLPDELERLNFYKKLLNAPPEDLQKILQEIEDLCGPAPESVKNIIRLMRLRKKVSVLGVRLIHQTGKYIEIFFRPKIQGGRGEYPATPPHETIRDCPPPPATERYRGSPIEKTGGEALAAPCVPVFSTGDPSFRAGTQCAAQVPSRKAVGKRPKDCQVLINLWIRDWQKHFGNDLEFLPSKLGDGLRISRIIENPIEFIEELFPAH